jgi:hypothetical protein
MTIAPNFAKSCRPVDNSAPKLAFLFNNTYDLTISNKIKPQRGHLQCLKNYKKRAKASPSSK